MKIPALTTQQMIEVDRLMVEEFGIALIQMMENAGLHLAELARTLLGGSVEGKRVAVFCGGGNNGGGGMVAARHLQNWGADVTLKVIANPKRIKDVPTKQLRILNALGIENASVPDLAAVDLILDALIGYGLSGDPTGPAAEWIKRINAARRPVLALDVPSGLNASDGTAGNPCIHATATLTLALPKTGLILPQANPFVGELYLGDISVPPQLYAAPSLGLQVGNMFARQGIIKVEDA